MASHLLLAALCFAGTSVASNSGVKCKGVSFSVTGSAQNVEASGVAYGSDSVNVTDFVRNATKSAATTAGTQVLAGWYCEPTAKNANSTKLQVLRGSFFTNRESWTALGGTDLTSPCNIPYQPEMYSWFKYANALGYPTLAIDSLGNGLSSRPDGLLVAQIPYDIAIYHDLVTQIRSGTTGQLPQAYSHLIHIGNSLGSTIGNNMAAAYPADFDEYVLTGWTKTVLPSLPGVSLNLPAPAVLVDPVRFAGLPLDYVTTTIEASLTGSFFGDPSFVDFDPAMAHKFFQQRDTISLGYTLTQYLPTDAPEAPDFTGRVLVLTGENDQAFCGLGSPILSPNAQCGSLLAETGTLFPAADYNYQSIPRSGHALILHKSAQQTFEVAHRFLAGASYGA